MAKTENADGERTEIPKADRSSAAERTFLKLQDMVISFEIRPGERINESELSRRLGVSRTPFREALNRLASDGFLEFIPAKGFYRKKIKPKEVFDLIHLRIAVEAMSGAIMSIPTD